MLIRSLASYFVLSATCWKAVPGFSSNASTGLYYLGELDVTKPSFVEILNLSPNSANDSYPDLVVTHFEEGFDNGINVFYDIGKELRNIANNSAPEQSTLWDKTFKWPNAVYIAPDGIFPADKTLIVHDGFLPPGHTNGGVFALLLNNSVAFDLIRLIPSTSSCYYHNSTMLDLNNDGLLDILVAQTCQSGVFKKVDSGTLLWLEQPASDPTNPESWTIHKLVAGPDILIQVQPLTSISLSDFIVYAAEFWAEKLSYYYLNVTDAGPVLSSEYVIDASIGAVYDVQVVDMLNDGRQQLLVQNHEADVNVTGIWLYEFPSDWPNSGSEGNATFEKVQIARGFNTTGGVGVGAPGFIYPFHLSVEEAGDPFRVAVAGDGNYFAWELVPQDGEKFVYDKVEIRNIDGTCGTLGVGDVDNDGYVEVFVPWYEKSKIYVYTANPNY